MEALAAHNTISKQALQIERMYSGLRDILLGPAHRAHAPAQFRPPLHLDFGSSRWKEMIISVRDYLSFRRREVRGRAAWLP